MTEPDNLTPEERIAALESQIQQMNQTFDSSIQSMQARIDELQVRAAMVPDLEARAAQANNLAMDLSDMTQERDRLKALLLGLVPDLEAFSTDYPQATIARTAFTGETPEEVAEKMAIWDAARAQKAFEWSSLVNKVRTQATA